MSYNTRMKAYREIQYMLYIAMQHKNYGLYDFLLQESFFILEE